MERKGVGGQRLRVLQIATVGDEEDEIFVGVREYPVSKIILIHEPEERMRAAEILHKLSVLKVDGERKEIRNPAKDMYEVIAEILEKERRRYDDVLINVSSGRKLLTCSAISAAFVNGLKAFHVEGEETMMLPVLKFSYSEIVSDSKLNILAAIDKIGGEVASLNELSERSGIEKSLLSYHIRGGRDSKGLEELGLVEIDRATQGRLIIRLTPMGRLLLIGRRTEGDGEGDGPRKGKAS
jgi:hypothetical protein